MVNDNKEKILFYEREIDFCEKTIEKCKVQILKYNKILEKIKNE